MSVCLSILSFFLSVCLFVLSSVYISVSFSLYMPHVSIYAQTKLFYENHVHKDTLNVLLDLLCVTLVVYEPRSEKTGLRGF